MLVLRRKAGESVIIAGAIKVSVLAVEGERVKIGISAPPDITLVREELLMDSSHAQAEAKKQESGTETLS